MLQVCLSTVDGWNPAPPAMYCIVAPLMLPPATPIISMLGWHRGWCRISAIHDCVCFLHLNTSNVKIQGVEGNPIYSKVVQDFSWSTEWTQLVLLLFARRQVTSTLHEVRDKTNTFKSYKRPTWQAIVLNHIKTYRQFASIFLCFSSCIFFCAVSCSCIPVAFQLQIPVANSIYIGGSIRRRKN